MKTIRHFLFAFAAVFAAGMAGAAQQVIQNSDVLAVGTVKINANFTELYGTKANSATTLAGYGIGDAFTKTEADSRYAPFRVPYANLPDQPGVSLLGRYSNGTGSPQVITLGSGLSLDTNTGVLTATGGSGGGASGTVTSIQCGTGLSGGTITTSGICSLAPSGVAAATYGSASAVPVVTVDTYGRVTSVSTASIPAAPVSSVAGKTGAVTLSTADVTGAAPLASPTFTGTPSAPTAASTDNSTQLATTAFVKAQGYTTATQAATAAPVQSVAGKTGSVSLTKADVGLTNVDNTSDASKPVSTAQAAADSAVQAFSIQRSNHTGTQPASTISGLAASATTDTTNASNINSGTLASAQGGAGTVNGLLKANGAGVTSAAAGDVDYVTIAGRGTGYPLLYNGNKTYTRKLCAAMAKVRAGTGNARILLDGDSTTYGYYGDNTLLHMNGFGPQAAKMTANLGRDVSGNPLNGGWQNTIGNGGVGLTTFATHDTRFTFGSNWSNNLSVHGGQAFKATTSGAPMTFTPNVAVDTFDIWYVQAPTAGTFNINLDGGANTLITATGSNLLAKTTLVAGSVGTHTLNITWVSSNVWIVGVEARASTKPEISFINAGWPGSTSGFWDGVETGPWNTKSAYPYLNPDATILTLGINDWNTSVPVATFTANMQDLITAAKTGGDVILQTPVPSAISTTPLATQQQYAAALRSLALTNNVPLIDMFAIWQSYEIENPLGYYYNTLHPNGLGFNDQAVTVLRGLQMLCF